MTFFFCRNPRGCRMCWDSHQWQINPEGRSDCSHKHKLVASSYCGLCHIKLCTSIFNRGAIWQPANGRHKRTAAHFSDAKKMHTQAKFRPCGSFFRICAFPPSVIIMRVCATILIAYILSQSLGFCIQDGTLQNRQKSLTVTEDVTQATPCPTLLSDVARCGNDGAMFPRTI